ncbi:uncharacterized protein AB675_10934 [Cyphellophora attinorum]|uniref:Uncharacterized protein n=1 Tax=Cyphellophora attinorum TaxID=1664694 RepID=A0A0N1GY82_9EURO|nr:uncharacterized protein AB675_10934 [Phialophora attinorum]KPI35513.1 hypothetical protein AB675_10934 [Phialophora attinorum]
MAAHATPTAGTPRPFGAAAGPVTTSIPNREPGAEDRPRFYVMPPPPPPPPVPGLNPQKPLSSVRRYQTQLDDHSRLVTRLLEEISNPDYHTSHHLRAKMSLDILSHHLDAWKTYVTQDDYDDFVKYFDKLELFEIADHWHDYAYTHGQGVEQAPLFQTKPTTSLFGSGTTTGAGLFGSGAATGTGATLFGTSARPAPPPPTALYGAPQPQPQPGFGSTAGLDRPVDTRPTLSLSPSRAAPPPPAARPQSQATYIPPVYRPPPPAARSSEPIAWDPGKEDTNPDGAPPAVKPAVPFSFADHSMPVGQPSVAIQPTAGRDASNKLDVVRDTPGRVPEELKKAVTEGRGTENTFVSWGADSEEDDAEDEDFPFILGSDEYDEVRKEHKKVDALDEEEEEGEEFPMDMEKIRAMLFEYTTLTKDEVEGALPSIPAVESAAHTK